jgi:hypothetical protein
MANMIECHGVYLSVQDKQYKKSQFHSVHSRFYCHINSEIHLAPLNEDNQKNSEMPTRCLQFNQFCCLTG